MTPEGIKKFLASWQPERDRTIVIVDFANVEKWKSSLGWKIGVPELGNLVKALSTGNVALRRFYFGSDYGRSDTSEILVPWSKLILDLARSNGFQVETKRVKYIPDGAGGMKKKCDLDVEMCIDLIKLRKHYDKIVLFSGDGDMAAALKFMRENYKKSSCVFGARDHLGKEIVDLNTTGKIENLFFAEDFEYRLNMDRMKSGGRSH